MKFVQKRLFNTNELEILDQGVRQRSTGFVKYLEYVIPFEDIGDRIYIETLGKKGWLTTACVTSCFAVVSAVLGSDYQNTLMWLVLAALSTAIYYFTRSNNLYLVGDKTIEFMRNVPSGQEIETFIKQIIDQRNLYLRSKYAKIDLDMPIEPQLNMIKRLKDINVLSEQEFDEMKKTLIQNNDTLHPIGFSG